MHISLNPILSVRSFRYFVYNPKPSYAEEREQQGGHEEEGLLPQEGRPRHPQIVALLHRARELILPARHLILKKRKCARGHPNPPDERVIAVAGGRGVSER